jgi:hypothetical protein
MFGRKMLVAALLLLAGASVAVACGPFFAWQLLDDRTATLKSTPKNSFAYEAAHLAPPPSDHLKPVELSSYQPDTDRAAAFDKAEEEGLSLQQVATLTASRNDATGDQSFADNASLPPTIRLYEAGLIDFHKANAAAAAARFNAILSLAAEQRDPRLVWATYMLGRIAAESGDTAAAAVRYTSTRQLVLHGWPDPLGLAVASYGEEAKLHYNHANSVLTGTPPPPAPPPQPAYPGAPIPPVNPTFAGYTLPPENAQTFRDEMAAATALYAQQAARGSDSGLQSLRIIAQEVLAVPERIDAVVPAPQLQRLLVVYALARIDDEPAQDQGPHDAGTREPGIKLNPLLPTLLGSIVKFGGRNPADADKLAALSYRTGRYDLAARLAAMSSSPLAEWVKAKIALQRGDLAAAAAHYAAASKGFPAAQGSRGLDSDNANLVVGETGTVALARGEYVDALDKLYPVAATYWGDVAYIAERVLTVDELKNFVDAKVPAAKEAPTPPQYGAPPTEPAAQLRNLLARRLMRENRSDEAFAYFNDPKVRTAAQTYAAALHDSKSDWGRVDRAQAFFAAATLARRSGMDILGTEIGPDYYNVGGLYDCCIGQDAPKGAYVTAGEQARAAASVVQPNIRYHYRYIAVDDASRAADLLPARSQAFAAVLCKATGWMMQTPGEGARAKSLYQRYVKNGPRVTWAKTFGRKCPDPDFAGAVAMERSHIYHHWRHYVSVHRWWLVGFVLLAGVAGVFGAMRMRKPSSKLGDGMRRFWSRISGAFRRR